MTRRRTTATRTASDELTNSRADCVAGTTEAKAPEAAADEFGVRAGRTTVLRVLDNDSSADCSMVVISVRHRRCRLNSVPCRLRNPVRRCRLRSPREPPGALPAVTYTVDDGLGRSASAPVSVTVAAPDDTRAPVKVRESATLVEVGGTVSYNVLPDFTLAGR